MTRFRIAALVAGCTFMVGCQCGGSYPAYSGYGYYPGYTMQPSCAPTSAPVASPNCCTSSYGVAPDDAIGSGVTTQPIPMNDAIKLGPTNAQPGSR